MKYDYLEDNPGLSDEHKRIIKEIKDEITYKNKLSMEMEANTDIQEYFAQFSEDSVKSFLQSYIYTSWLWHTQGKIIAEMYEEDEEFLINDLFEHLETIQQKKLFNLQCLWRAERIQIEGLKFSIEFDFWDHNIFNCPYIPSITKEELDVYIGFLLGNDKRVYYDGDWQDYHALKDAYNKERKSDYVYPEWYEYYDEYYGTGELIGLPDIRGSKEHDYLQGLDRYEGYYDKFMAEKFKQYQERKQDLNFYNPENTEWFVSRFGSKNMDKYRDAYYDNMHRSSDQDIEGFGIAFKLISNCLEIIPIEKNNDWRDAIKRAWYKYERKIHAEGLPGIFEQYKMKIDCGIGFPADDKFSDLEDIIEKYTKKIIETRLLRGEPGDLNY